MIFSNVRRCHETGNARSANFKFSSGLPPRLGTTDEPTLLHYNGYGVPRPTTNELVPLHLTRCTFMAAAGVMAAKWGGAAAGVMRVRPCTCACVPMAMAWRLMHRPPPEARPPTRPGAHTCTQPHGSPISRHASFAAAASTAAGSGLAPLTVAVLLGSTRTEGPPRPANLGAPCSPWFAAERP